MKKVSTGRVKGITLDRGILKTMRRDRGLTQDQVAEIAGITTRSYQNAEGGRPVSYDLGHRISAALGHPFASLVRPSAQKVRARLMMSGFAPVPPPSIWGAREREIEAIGQMLDQKDGHGNVCCLTGPTGIGKTALAHKTAEILEKDFPDGIVWVTASRNTSDIIAATTMVHIARSLDFDYRLPGPNDIAPELFHQAFLKILWSRKRLLILDDVESLNQLGRFQPVQANSQEGWMLLTTTRRSVAQSFGQAVLELGPLSLESSLTLLEERVGTERLDESPGAARALVDLLGGVPRNLLIAGNVLDEERYTKLQDYVERLNANAAGLESERHWLSFKDETSFVSAYAQVRQRLDDRLWRFFGSLSVFLDTLFSPHWAAAVGQVPLEEAMVHLSLLADFYLIREILLEEPGQDSNGTSPTARFVLDAQAQRIARSVAASELPDIQRRFSAFALNEAQRISKMDLEAGARCFSGEIQVWRHYLNLATELVCPLADGDLPRAPDDVPTVTDPIAEAARPLPEILITLRQVMELTMSPETGAWTTAGIALARHLGNRLHAGHISLIYGRWRVFDSLDFEGVWHFGLAAADALIVEDTPEAAYSAMFYAACGALSTRGVAVAMPLYERCIEIAQKTGLDPRYKAHSLLTKGVVCTAFQEDRRDRESIVSSFEESLACCPKEGKLNRIIWSNCLLNLAVVRRLEGAALPEDDVEESLAFFMNMVKKDQLLLWLLERVGHFLGLPKWRDSKALTETRQREILLSFDPVAMNRRLVKFFELVYQRAGQPSLFEAPEPSSPYSGTFNDERVGLLEISLGSTLEIELGHMLAILYPVRVIDELLDERGLSLARSFVANTVGPHHPAIAILDHFDAFRKTIASKG